MQRRVFQCILVSTTLLCSYVTGDDLLLGVAPYAAHPHCPLGCWKSSPLRSRHPRSDKVGTTIFIPLSTYLHLLLAVKDILLTMITISLKLGGASFLVVSDLWYLSLVDK